MEDGAPGPGNLPEYSVSEISQQLKRTVESAFERVRVRGEISRPTRAASGHIYLTLKDDKAVIDGICWRGNAARLSVQPEEGMEVICVGKLTTYPGRSKYQMVIEQMELAGEGALLKLLEDRRRKLGAEGLFDGTRKRPLPYLPSVIGVVTSPTGAVIRDILHRLTDRFPVQVLVWPVLVQGESAKDQIARAIHGFNAFDETTPLPRPDLLIVARGGGSLEDLWAFNEEIVVHAAAESAIPLISAVGHETDTTLIDFASDKRAPTPTAAAEMAVPVRAELLALLMDDEARLFNALRRRMSEANTQLTGLARGLGDPAGLIGAKGQALDYAWAGAEAGLRGKLDEMALSLARTADKLQSPHARLATMSGQLQLAARRLDISLKTNGTTAATRLGNASKRLSTAPLERALTTAGRDHGAWSGRLENALDRRISNMEQRFAATHRLLESNSFERTLDRGFAVVRAADGSVISATGQVKSGEAVSLRLRDGEVGAVIVGGSSAPRPQAKAKSDAKPKESSQETLF